MDTSAQVNSAGINLGTGGVIDLGDSATIADIAGIEAINPTINLSSNILTIADSGAPVLLRLSGTPTFNTTFDSTANQGGQII